MAPVREPGAMEYAVFVPQNESVGVHFGQFFFGEEQIVEGT